MERLLPSGMEDFAEIRECGFCYVDKTAFIHKLITGSGRSFFLSRPRRFGKSLLCSTLRAVFEGRRDLFGEIAGRPTLAIDSLDWGWRKHPVIKFSLNSNEFSAGLETLNGTLRTEVLREAGKCGVRLESGDVVEQFKWLIQFSCETFGEKAVVIVDEYDKPHLDTIGDSVVHEDIKRRLCGFYGVLKAYSEYLRFVFLTGITRFSKVSIFSVLNNLTDISFRKEYAQICGFTEEEVERDFGPEIESVAAEHGVDVEEYLGRLRGYYNGYRFSALPTTVYNPYGLLLHFSTGGEFEPFWYETGSPSFLIRLMSDIKLNIGDQSNMRITKESLDEFHVGDMDALAVLYQSGYLTIKDYDIDNGEYLLDFPNTEVREAFVKSLMRHRMTKPTQDSDAPVELMRVALDGGDIDTVIDILYGFLESIPYGIIRTSERYLQLAVHLVFSSLGRKCSVEKQTVRGRIDLTVETASFNYCFEFKLDKSSDEAMRQINEKGYADKWLGRPQTVIKVGVAFGHEERNIVEWQCEVVEPRVRRGR